MAVALRTLETVQYAAPSATPVAISRSGDAAIVRAAMLAGARGFLVTGTPDEEFVQVIQKARGHHERLMNPQLIADKPAVAGTILTVFGPKGGIGKTTVATNLAVSLRQRTQAKVVLVDLDSYFGDVAIMMGLQPEYTFANLLVAMRNGSGAPKDFLTHHRSGLDILAAPHSADSGLQPTVDEIVTILRALANSYDFVIVDTPGAFGPLIATALDESSLIFLVTSADLASIKDVRLALEILRGAGFEPEKLKLVVNHATNADSVSDNDLSRTLGYDIFWSFPHDREVPVATQHGVPLTIANPKATMARTVDALAAHLAGSDTASDPVGDRESIRFSAAPATHRGSLFASIFSRRS
jgi:pilus assembly protein CpaE